MYSVCCEGAQSRHQLSQVVTVAGSAPASPFPDLPDFLRKCFLRRGINSSLQSSSRLCRPNSLDIMPPSPPPVLLSAGLPRSAVHPYTVVRDIPLSPAAGSAIFPSHCRASGLARSSRVSSRHKALCNLQIYILRFYVIYWVYEPRR